MRIATFAAAGRAFTLLAVLASIGGCATKGDVRDVQRQIQDLARSTDAVRMELEEQGRVTADTLRTQASQLVDFRGSVTSQLREIRSLLDQLTELTGQNQRTVAAIRDQMESLNRTASRPSSQRDTPGILPDGTQDPNAPVEAFNAAVEYYNLRSNVAARLGFTDFLRQYPNDPFAADARYWLADILVQEGNYDDAMDAFSEIRELHPEHERVPEALLRMATLQEIEYEDIDEAKRLLDTILNSYSDSPVAEQAREALDRIGG